MAIKVNYSTDPEIARLQRKRDQAWEMAGEARMQGGDKEAEKKYMEEARGYQELIQELR